MYSGVGSLFSRCGDVILNSCVSFATAMTNDEISITASHYALFTFLFTLFNGAVGCVPSQNKHVNHHPREIHLSKSESNAFELTPSPSCVI
jgi:hypothetical protein